MSNNNSIGVTAGCMPFFNSRPSTKKLLTSIQTQFYSNTANQTQTWVSAQLNGIINEKTNSKGVEGAIKKCQTAISNLPDNSLFKTMANAALAQRQDVYTNTPGHAQALTGELSIVSYPAPQLKTDHILYPSQRLDLTSPEFRAQSPIHQFNTVTTHFSESGESTHSLGIALLTVMGNTRFGSPPPELPQEINKYKTDVSTYMNEAISRNSDPDFKLWDAQMAILIQQCLSPNPGDNTTELSQLAHNLVNNKVIRVESLDIDSQTRIATRYKNPLFTHKTPVIPQKTADDLLELKTGGIPSMFPIDKAANGILANDRKGRYTDLILLKNDIIISVNLSLKTQQTPVEIAERLNELSHNIVELLGKHPNPQFEAKFNYVMNEIIRELAPHL